MSIYNPNIPLAPDDLSDSQGQILQNFQRANSSFGIDHYPFANQSVDNGKHNQVTTPVYVANPPTGSPPVTIAAEPKLYAFQDSANLGVLQYSRGPSNAVPTPITHLQSPATPLVIGAGGDSPILDFNLLTHAICMVYAADMSATSVVNLAMVTWNGSVFGITILNNAFPTVSLTFTTFGKILQVTNSSAVPMNNVYWTLDILRSY